MRLLVISQKLDREDDVLGFFHRWIGEFSRQTEAVNVICLTVGKWDLPGNVRVFSLGKEGGRSRLKYLYNFYRALWQLRGQYDAVWVHMHPEYILLGFWWWRWQRVPISLWYAHGHTPWKLRLAEPLLDTIFTSTGSGCRLPSRKIKVIGQGIDTERFAPLSRPAEPSVAGPLKIISVGRIAPSKDYETLISAVKELTEAGLIVSAEIIGNIGLTADQHYRDRLEHLIQTSGLAGHIKLAGPVANRLLPARLQQVDLFVNMGQTGSLDKAIVEAMAAGLPILTCNEALVEVLGPYAGRLMYPKRVAAALAQKIRWFQGLTSSERAALGAALRQIVIDNHSLPRFVAAILSELLRL